MTSMNEAVWKAGLAALEQKPTYRHKKRGGLYEVLTDTASIQCSSAPEFEDAFGDENWTVYRNVKTGAIYLRLTEEFNDGRFERVTESQPVE